jgi:ATP-dependent Clp protease protease subunit
MKACFVLMSLLVFGSVAAQASEAGKKEVVLSKDNLLVLNEAVSGKSSADLLKKARELDATLPSQYPIVLFLDTPGGSIQAGLEIIEVLSAMNRPVDTVTLFAASMGFQIVQGLNKRYVMETGTLMSHKAYGGFEGEFGGEGPSQIDSRYGFWLRRLLLLDQKVVGRTGGKQTLSSYQRSFAPELWVFGKEAVDQGYADAVVSVKCDKSLSGKNARDYEFLGFKISLLFSECPMITYPVEIQSMVQTPKGYMLLSDFLAKGGVLGKKCESEFGFNRYDSYQSLVYGPSPVGADSQPAAGAPCATNEKLTLEEIEARKKEKLQEVTNKDKKATIRFIW